MAKINKLYRAFVDYRKITANDPDLKRDRKYNKTINKEDEFFEAIKIDCSIEEDWVLEIESKIEYVTKAVNEERQFIETVGEVVPIEKVKKVSKDSVKHLAKHSNLITKLPENEEDDIIPEKLYMVEKISDYTVYENRFLYMMLCYLRDFIDLRVSKIQEAMATYKSNFKMKKYIETKSRILSFETNFYEDRKDNPYSIINEKTKDILERINTFSHDVQALLATDLMQQVSQAPMIKPPITKTNVLKMNNNFKNAVALYEYLASYDKLGYTLTEQKKELHPFEDPLADEMVELVHTTSFLSYKYGNDLESILKEQYDEEEKLRRIEEQNRTREQIKALKRHITESGMGYEEYMLMLEKHNRDLEKDSADLVVAKNEIENLKLQMAEFEKEKKILQIRIEELSADLEATKAELIDLKQRYDADMAKKDQERISAINNLSKKHQGEIDELNQSHDAEIEELIQKNKEEISNLEDAHQNEINELNNEFNLQLEEKNKLNRNLNELNRQLNVKMEQNEISVKNELNRLERERVNLNAEYEKYVSDNLDLTNREIMKAKASVEEAQEQVRYANAKLNAVKRMHGMLTDEDDFTSRERFLELELQKEAFNKLFKEEWKKTKQKIKEAVFSGKLKEVAKEEVKEELPSEKTSEQLVEENNLNSETEK